MKAKCCGTCQWYSQSPYTNAYGFCEADIGDITKPDEYCRLYVEDSYVSSEEEE